MTVVRANPNGQVTGQSRSFSLCGRRSVAHGYSIDGLVISGEWFSTGCFGGMKKISNENKMDEFDKQWL